VTLNSGFIVKTKNIHQFCFLGMCFFLGLLTHIFSSDSGSGLGSLKVLFLPVALFFQIVSIIVLCTSGYRDRVVFILKKDKLLLLSLIFIMLSSLWSIDKVETIRRGVALLGTTGFGLLVGLTFSRLELLSFLRNSFLTIVVFSVLLAIVLPQYGTHVGGEFDGFWRGVLSFKNQMGWVASIFLILWVSNAQSSGNYQVAKFILGLLLGGLLLVQTHSATGLIATLLGFVLLILLKLNNALNIFKIIFKLFIAISIITIVIFYESLLEIILGFLGKDLTLTGRTSIWLALIPIIEDNIYLGVGYSAFWPNVEDFLGYSWMSLLNHAHNAYIELIVDLGIIGSGICILFIIKSIRTSFLEMSGEAKGADVIFVLWCVVASIGMSGKVFFVPNAGVWVLMIALFVTANAGKSRDGALNG
jgi:exopolysaccharide production protein ExoQ